MTSTAIYRALMEAFETRRRELGLSMNTDEIGLNDLAGAADGYYAKMIFPDTPSGRQARWETVDEFASVLFGAGYSIEIIPGHLNRKTLTALSLIPNPSDKAIQNRHWRHSRHFSELGALGAKARNEKLSKAQRIKIARKGGRMWRKICKAKRMGEERRAESKQAAAKPAPAPAT